MIVGCVPLYPLVKALLHSRKIVALLVHVQQSLGNMHTRSSQICIAEGFDEPTTKGFEALLPHFCRDVHALIEYVTSSVHEALSPRERYISPFYYDIASDFLRVNEEE